MMIVICVAALAGLALLTQAGVVVLQWIYPARGAPIAVTGARLNVLDSGPRDATGPAIVMIHGATSNLGSMRVPIGDRLAQTHRVILIDRPGHGWSTRDNTTDSSPAMQARQIDEALGKLGVSRAIIVVHSLAGAIAPLLALDYPRRVAGLVMLAPVAYPWPGGVGVYNDIVTTPVVGPLLAYTITLPLGLFLTEPGARSVFKPQTMPDHYVKDAAIPLVLRPHAFLANAWDLVTLKPAIAAQAPRYPAIKVPVTIITGDADNTVYPDVHSKPFAKAVPGAKLIMLPGVGHMVQNAAPDLVVREIEAMIAGLGMVGKQAAE
ncbi:MAG: alpha/beta hydrolase fold protein [Tardiphaga sp.]|nr:alpha/beta hydrolase fold protein [Tardiphaga sp.]